MKKLISLDDYEKLKTNPRQLGIGVACPNCGSELKDESPGMVYCTIPPKKRVVCSNIKCNFETLTYA